MEALPYLIPAFAPGLFWLWYFRRKDDLEPEPRLLVLLVFGLGCAAAGVALLLRPYLDPLIEGLDGWPRAVADAFFVTALSEEAVKFIAFFFGAFWLRELDEPLDGIVYGVAVGLGFASVENFLYVKWTGDPLVVVPRAFTATLGHVGFSGALGYFFGRAKFSRGLFVPVLMVAGFLFAVVFHGLYDIFLMVGGDYWPISILGLLPLLMVLLGLKIRWSRARSTKFHPELPDPVSRRGHRRRRSRRRKPPTSS